MTRPLIIVGLALLLAAALQGNVAPSIAVGPALPDLVLLTLTCGIVLTGRSAALGLGVWAAVLTASLQLGFVGSLLLSRVLAALLAGALCRVVARDSLLTPPLLTLCVTLCAECAYLFLAPGHALQSWTSARLWAAQTGGEAFYNAVLSLPLLLILRRLAGRSASSDSFIVFR